MPLSIKNDGDEKKNRVYISNNLKKNENVCFSFSKNSPGEICFLEVDNCWGVPQNIRGKSITLKYLKFSDNKDQF